MTDDHEVTAAVPVTVRGHPARLPPGDVLAAAYQPLARAAGAWFAEAAFAPWDPRARFAPPGPSRASLTAPACFMTLAMPAAPALIEAALPSPDLPEAMLDETAMLERIADIATPAYADEAEWTPIEAYEPAVEEPEPAADASLHPDEPGAALDHERPAEHDVAQPPDVASLPGATPAAQPAYWATADSLAWPPPAPSEPGEAKRATPAMAGLWATEPVVADGDNRLAQDNRPRMGRGARIAAIAAGAVVLVAACIAAILVVPRLLTQSSVPIATFNAPMMVLRAAGVGRVASVQVTNGQSVQPATVLLTIHTDPLPDPAASLLRDRLEAAQGRLAALDDALTQPTANTDAGRAHLADLRSQRAAAANDVAQLKDAVANIPAKPPTDQPVRAGVHGVVRSLEAQTGMPTAGGVPLVRMLDCDHAFLTVPSTAQLHAGEAVQVKLANLAAVPATVRSSSGIAEPPDALVIAPAPGAFVPLLSGSCPVGATATITPSITGS